MQNDNEKAKSGSIHKKRQHNDCIPFPRLYFHRVPFIRFSLSILLIVVLFFSCGENSGKNILKIGISEEPRTLNIWLASDANSKKVLSLIYQHLYIRDPETLKLVPWLAEDHPVYDPESIAYTIKLRPANWSDGSPLTSSDVAFTVDLIKKFKIPQYLSKWTFVEKIETPDSRTVKFYLKRPTAIFLTRSLDLPIVSRKEWDSLAKEASTREKPLNVLLNHRMTYPLGSGPFILKEQREGAYLYFEKNPFFFGENSVINGYTLGPYVDKVIFKAYTSADVAILALKKGSIDYHWADIQPGHIKGLKTNSSTRVFVSKKSAFYFMGFNVRKPPFSDPVLRKAVAMVVDKTFLISRILQGFAENMFSVVPQGNGYWCCPDLPAYCDGLAREERIKHAWAILSKNGYTWDTPPVNEKGEVTRPSTIRLPGGGYMEELTILTPPADYDPHRAACGTIIQEWVKDLGLPAVSRPMSFGALLDKIKGKHDFDTFILGYGKLSLDPDYLRSFFHSQNDRKRGWNMSGYRNEHFDRLADASITAMDPEKRQQLIWEMQKLVLADLPYIPLYNPMRIEAVNKNDFSGWIKMVGGIGNIWSFCTLKPNEG